MNCHQFQEYKFYSNQKEDIKSVCCIKCKQTAWLNTNTLLNANRLRDERYEGKYSNISFAKDCIIIRVNELNEVVEKIACIYSDEEWYAKEIIE